VRLYCTAFVSAAVLADYIRLLTVTTLEEKGCPIDHRSGLHEVREEALSEQVTVQLASHVRRIAAKPCGTLMFMTELDH